MNVDGFEVKSLISASRLPGDVNFYCFSIAVDEYHTGLNIQTLKIFGNPKKTLYTKNTGVVVTSEIQILDWICCLDSRRLYVRKVEFVPNAIVYVGEYFYKVDQANLSDAHEFDLTDLSQYFHPNTLQNTRRLTHYCCNNPEWLKLLPDHIITSQFCFEVAKLYHSPRVLDCIPDHIKTDEFVRSIAPHINYFDPTADEDGLIY